MPSTTIVSEDSIIFRVKDEGKFREPVSNFSIDVTASVHVSSDAGGPGLLLPLKRHHDNVEK